MEWENELEKYFRLVSVEIEKFAIFRALILTFVACLHSDHKLSLFNVDWEMAKSDNLWLFSHDGGRESLSIWLCTIEVDQWVKFYSVILIYSGRKQNNKTKFIIVNTILTTSYYYE